MPEKSVGASKEDGEHVDAKPPKQHRKGSLFLNLMKAEREMQTVAEELPQDMGEFVDEIRWRAIVENAHYEVVYAMHACSMLASSFIGSLAQAARLPLRSYIGRYEIAAPQAN